jgi:uncharacterized protein
MSQITLTALYRYPVKSLRGSGFDELAVDARGLAGDRRWMVVDGDGRFVTQRQHPRMCLVDTALDGDGRLTLRAPGMSPLTVAQVDGGRRQVVVWDDQVEAEQCDPAVDAWLSDFLGIACRLVRMPDDSVRPVDPDYAGPGHRVGFADGFPFLLISEASLDELNGRLTQPVPMARFRPNLVVAGCEAFAEDGWRRIRIGGLAFDLVKPCSRCIIPTIDIATGQRDAEPLRTLMGYRKRDNRILFGQNLVHDGVGLLRRGMPVQVLE